MEGGEEEDEMGVIRKKTANRLGEGGVKYVCDVCSADITSTVSSWWQFMAYCADSDIQIPG